MRQDISPGALEAASGAQSTSIQKHPSDVTVQVKMQRLNLPPKNKPNSQTIPPSEGGGDIDTFEASIRHDDSNNESKGSIRMADSPD